MSQSTVLVVEDDLALQEALSDTLELAGYDVAVASDGRAALSILDTQAVDMVVSDVQMKPMDGVTLLKHLKQRRADLPMLLMTAYGSIEKAVEAMRDGAVDYLVKPFEAEVLVNTVSRYMGQSEADDTGMVAADPKTQEVQEMVRRVAASDATVLITGPSGAGKEVLARFIHEQSPRANRPFVAINCAAIPENMLEATLFGYEKGAFTGAYKSSPGKFEQAQGGTLLLDEISEMDLGLQAKLLRVLQEREVERLGGTKLIELDVRVLATSNRNMLDEVQSGRFREDLYYRLNVFPVHLPTLAERPQDIVPIAERLLEKHARRAGRSIPVLSESAQARLLAHVWPGNVRELDNLVQRALILQAGELIQAEDLHFEPAANQPAQSAAVAPAAVAASPVAPAAPADSEADGLGEDLKNHEQNLILDALRNTMGSRKLAAERLGISQRTLRYKLARMREQGIAVP